MSLELYSVLNEPKCESDCNQCPNMGSTLQNAMVANTNGYLLHMFSKLPIKQLEFKQAIKE